MYDLNLVLKRNKAKIWNFLDDDRTYYFCLGGFFTMLMVVIIELIFIVINRFALN